MRYRVTITEYDTFPAPDGSLNSAIFETVVEFRPDFAKVLAALKPPRKSPTKKAKA